jgi:predicted DNA-binding protein with PD1-like motif
MISGESAVTRCVMGRVEAGEEVVAALRALARLERIDAGFVRAQGAVVAAELARYDGAARAYVGAGVVTGPAELVLAQGSFSLEDGAAEPWLWAVVAPAAGAPIAGRLFRATAVHVEFAVDVLDDGDLERRPDEATGLPLWRPPRRRRR